MQRTATLTTVVISLVALFATDLKAAQPEAVPTFECIGLYWRPAGGAADNTCSARYRKVGDKQWSRAMDLWYDARTMSPVGTGGRGPDQSTPWPHAREYRGSIVNLQPGTEYEIELSLAKTDDKGTLKVRTWSEKFPVAKRIDLADSSETLNITEGGSPDGYVLYAPRAGAKSAVIDVAGKQDQCIEVRASYVIIRGLTLKAAAIHGIRIFKGCHDIVIEGCDISGWGRISEDGWAKNLDSAVYSNERDLARVIIQRNRIHNPRGDSNNWREERPRPGKREAFHPEGPQAVYFSNNQGNHVFRYNTITSDQDHQYNDIFGGSSNFSAVGFPNRDSDCYGNYLTHCWDDSIEFEGANANVRIWGNYSTDCFVAIATATTSVGPLYIWRNVSNYMRVADNDPGSGGFIKTSDIMGGGPIYVFHNTVLQPSVQTDKGKVSAGASTGIGWGGPVINTTSRNNIFHVKSRAFRDRSNNPTNDYDYDLYRGTLPDAVAHQEHGIMGEPKYRPGSTLGHFTLAPDSPGFDAGVIIPNFNDNFTGKAPDMGAHEAGAPPMQYGADAYLDNNWENPR